MSPSVTVRLLATQSDTRLAELARHGHERAFEALVQRYRRPLLGYCRRLLLPEARAEDAVQQALLQAWLALQKGEEVREVRPWLYRIVHNTALNALRRSGYDYAELSEALSGADAPQETLDRRIAVRETLAGLAALPEQQREALLRTAVEGASHAVAAAEMGVSETALRGLVYRARASMRTVVTAITPMPLANWAAGAAGHGPAVAELAVGGGSAGLAGLLAKSGAILATAGVLAAGAGTVVHVRHRSGHAASSRAHQVQSAGASAPVDATPAASAPIVPPPAAGTVPALSSHRHGTHRRGEDRGATAPTPAAAPVQPSGEDRGGGDDHGGQDRGGDRHGGTRGGGDDRRRNGRGGDATGGGGSDSQHGGGGVQGDHGTSGTGSGSGSSGSGSSGSGSSGDGSSHGKGDAGGGASGSSGPDGGERSGSAPPPADDPSARGVDGATAIDGGTGG